MGEDTRKEQRWKGFADKELAAFGIKRREAGMEVPYFTRDGKLYRVKRFPWGGEPRSCWLGASKPQLPYGLWRLPPAGDAVILTEGETDLIALSLAFPKVPVLGIPGADSWETEWRAYVADYRRVYLSFDGDPSGDGRVLPGKRPRKIGTGLFEKVRADIPEGRYVMLPDGADTRDVLQRLGKAAYKVLVELADRGWEEKVAREAMNAAVLRRHRQVVEPWDRQA